MKLSSIAAVLFTAALPFIWHQTGVPSGQINPIVTSEINQVIKSANFQGTALVAQNGQVIHHQGYGMAVREWNILNIPETRFQIASISKTFTAALIMMLVEDGQIELDVPFQNYLADYPAHYAETVTVRQLLTHRSGIARQFKIHGWTSGKSLSPLSRPEFLSMIAAMPLASTPGTKRHYSSANYYILSAIIEAVTGQRFGEWLQAKILLPLGMTNSDIFRSGQIVPNLARAYKSVTGQYSFCPPISGPYCLGGHINFELFKGSGSMHSTASDLLKWDQALYDSSLLNAESKAFLFASQTQAVWDVADIPLTVGKKTKIMIAHGELEGYASLIIRFPNEQRTIILLNNTGMPYEQLIDVAHRIAVLFYQE